MELSVGLLVLICVAAGAIAFWHVNLAAREAANRAAMAACEQLRLQFLDGTVSFARARPVRGASGWLTLRRTYVFDYTADSIARRRGFIVMTGLHIDSVGFESDTPQRQARQAAPTVAVDDSRDANVLKLDDWRGQRRHESDGGSGQDEGGPGTRSH
ncbi:MAG TPA: DUF3301 domain-containing protein [Steroidobacteraceae bacterium]|nr:DUF3301 domain-containing protein [Steroidobacteraceae bacterium]